MQDYYIIYNPITYDLMGMVDDRNAAIPDVLKYLTNRDPGTLSSENFTAFLKFDPSRIRHGLNEFFGFENYATYYIANQVAAVNKNAMIYIADGRRRKICRIIENRGSKPRAVFITTISANFPVAALVAIVLNYGEIPVLIGGIHVSTMPEDIDRFIRPYAPSSSARSGGRVIPM